MTVETEILFVKVESSRVFGEIRFSAGEKRFTLPVFHHKGSYTIGAEGRIETVLPSGKTVGMAGRREPPEWCDAEAALNVLAEWVESEGL